MKYYDLIIYTDDSFENYNAISLILNITPLESKDTKFGSKYCIWTYRIERNDDEPYLDFINVFLDLLEPKFVELERIGVTKKKILFWLLYNYNQQCAMEFHPQEMKRLGESGINLNIDCWSISPATSTAG